MGAVMRARYAVPQSLPCGPNRGAYAPVRAKTCSDHRPLQQHPDLHVIFMHQSPHASTSGWPSGLYHDSGRRQVSPRPAVHHTTVPAVYCWAQYQVAQDIHPCTIVHASLRLPWSLQHRCRIRALSSHAGEPVADHAPARHRCVSCWTWSWPPSHGRPCPCCSMPPSAAASPCTCCTPACPPRGSQRWQTSTGWRALWIPATSRAPPRTCRQVCYPPATPT
jgi:hypothetical protein